MSKTRKRKAGASKPKRQTSKPSPRNSANWVAQMQASQNSPRLNQYNQEQQLQKFLLEAAIKNDKQELLRTESRMRINNNPYVISARRRRATERAQQSARNKEQQNYTQRIRPTNLLRRARPFG